MLVDASRHVGFWTWEVRPDHVFADPIMSAYFGMQAEDGERGPPLERFMEAIHSDDRDRIRTAITRAVTTGEPYREAYRVKTLFGQERTLIAVGRCFRDARGRPHLYPGHITDITVRRTGTSADIYDQLSRSRDLAAAEGKLLLEYLISMAMLECSDDKMSGKDKFSLLN